ncbi:FLYWCH zinc finger domain-containing protein [Phthorimaea operculella]|nr:FLYWCH zinc finger domain-containing protein [Phthorimaea operculella]
MRKSASKCARITRSTTDTSIFFHFTHPNQFQHVQVSFVYNIVGKQLCIYKGYSFFPNSKKSAMSQYWRCTRKSSNCKATLSTTHRGELIHRDLLLETEFILNFE